MKKIPKKEKYTNLKFLIIQVILKKRIIRKC